MAYTVVKLLPCGVFLIYCGSSWTAAFGSIGFLANPRPPLPLFLGGSLMPLVFSYSYAIFWYSSSLSPSFCAIWVGWGSCFDLYSSWQTQQISSFLSLLLIIGTRQSGQFWSSIAHPWRRRVPMRDEHCSERVLRSSAVKTILKLYLQNFFK